MIYKGKPIKEWIEIVKEYIDIDSDFKDDEFFISHELYLLDELADLSKEAELYIEENLKDYLIHFKESFYQDEYFKDYFLSFTKDVYESKKKDNEPIRWYWKIFNND